MESNASAPAHDILSEEMATGVTDEGSSSLELEPPTPKFVCSPCSKDGRNVEAMCRCMNCEETFCSHCLSSHQKFNFTRDHTILQGAEMQDPEKTNAPLLPKERCQEHHSRVMDMYCREHNLVCCATCIAEHHRDCEDAEYIPKVAVGMQNSEELRQAKSDSVDVVAEIKQLKHAREEDIKRIKNEKEEIFKNIASFKESIIRRLDELGESAMKEVDELFSRYETKFKEDLRRLNELLINVENNAELLQKFESENESQLFVHVKRNRNLSEEVAAMKVELNEVRDNVQFTLDKSSLEYVEKLESIGHVVEFTPFSLTLERTRCVKRHYDKKTCDLSGCCILEDGRMVVADFGNSKLTLLGKSDIDVKDIILAKEPRDICAIGKDEIAVALPDTIQFATVSDTIILTSSISVNDNMRGIAYSNQKVFACFQKLGTGEIQIFRKTGRRIKTILFQIDKCIPRQFALTGHGEESVVADRYGKVILFDGEGSILWKFEDPCLKEPMCVRMLDARSLCVTCSISHTMLLLALKGKQCKVLLNESNGLKFPFSMAYDRINKRLVVVSDESNVFAVYNVVAES